MRKINPENLTKEQVLFLVDYLEAKKEVSARDAELARGLINNFFEDEEDEKPKVPTPSQAEKIESLTAELIKKDKAIEHWKRIAENAKAKGDGYLNEKIILEEKLRKINAGENPSDRVRELEEENSYLRQAIAKAQIELARLSEKLPSHWERPDDFKFPKFPEHWWVSAPTAGGTD